MFAGEGQLADIIQQNLNSVLEEDEVDRSHIQLVEDVKQLSEGIEEIEEETIEEFLIHIEKFFKNNASSTCSSRSVLHPRAWLLTIISTLLFHIINNHGAGISYVPTQ